MTESYRGYSYRVDFRQEQTGAWFAKISVSRPDGSSLGPYEPRTPHRSREFVKNEAEEFIKSEITHDLDQRHHATTTEP